MKTGKLVVVSVLVLVVTAFGIAQPAAAAKKCVVEDSVGDATYSPGIVGEAYQDMVSASVALKDGRFVFVLQVAGMIPESPPLPLGVKLLSWAWDFSTDDAVPIGFPFSPGLPAPPEFFIVILWDGTAFAGTLIDRRPLLTGEDATTRSVSFSIKVNTFTATVDTAIVGDPSMFTWASFTALWLTELGTGGFLPLDFLPLLGTWPC